MTTSGWLRIFCVWLFPLLHIPSHVINIKSHLCQFHLFFINVEVARDERTAEMRADARQMQSTGKRRETTQSRGETTQSRGERRSRAKQRQRRKPAQFLAMNVRSARELAGEARFFIGSAQ